MIRKLFTAAVLAATALATPAGTLVAVSPVVASDLCGPDAPESYKRPGGFCEAVENTGSLSKPASPTTGADASDGLEGRFGPRLVLEDELITVKPL